MIDTSLPHLQEEIEAGNRKRDARLESLEPQVRRYHGPWYDGEGPSDIEPDPENHVYTYLSAFIPATVHSAPRVNATSRRPTAQKDATKAIETGVNRWVRDTRFIDVLEELAYDFYFRWFVALVSVKPRKEHYGISPDPMLLPDVVRLSPGDAGWDAQATHPEKARIQWHRWRIDKDDLIEIAEEDRKLPRKDREGWNLKVIRSLQTGYEEEGRYGDFSPELDRKQLELYDVYLPDDQPDPSKGPEQGYHGSIRTIALGHSAGNSKSHGPGLVRKATPHFGPSPYVVAGCYLVPEQSEPLSPIVATQGQSDTLNSFVSSMLRDIEGAKNIILMTGMDPKSAERINSTPHNQVALVEDVINLRDNVAQFALGAVDPQRFPVAGWLRDMLERNSGFNDVAQGQVTGAGTATEVTFAQDAASARSDYPGLKFVRGVERILNKVGEFMYRTDQIIFPLGIEGMEAVNAGLDDPYPDGSEAWFFGGTTETGDGGSWEDMEITMDASSMRRVSKGSNQAKSEVFLRFTTEVWPIWVQIPGFDLRGATQKYGDLNDFPELVDLFDFEAATGQPMLPQPMLSRQAGTIATKATNFYERAPTLPKTAGASNPMAAGQAAGQSPTQRQPQPLTQGAR